MKDRFVLLGDAAGYVDAITGEGLSLAFTSAQVLAELSPEALKRDAAARIFAEYERTLERLLRRYAWLAGTLVWAAGPPGLRRFAVNRLADFPALSTWALGYAMGQSEPVTSSPQLVR